MEIRKKRKKMTEARKEYKKSKQIAKRVISLAKGKKLKECANDLNESNHQNEIFRVAKQTVKKTGCNGVKLSERSIR